MAELDRPQGAVPDAGPAADAGPGLSADAESRPPARTPAVPDLPSGNPPEAATGTGLSADVASTSDAEAADHPIGRPPLPASIPGVLPSSGETLPYLGVPSEAAERYPRRLTHDSYHDLVRERMRDLDRLDPAGPDGRRHLTPGPELLVALDVDGTILDMEGRVSERVMASIARLRTYGSQVVIATGRGIQAALPVARHVGLTTGWMVCANGAVTVRLDPDLPGGYEVAEQITFDPAEVIDTLHRAFPEGIIAVEIPGAVFRVSKPFPDGELIEKATVCSLEQLRAEPASRVILRAPGMSVDRFSEAVRSCGLQSVEYAIGWTAWLDVAPEGITKASALESLATRLGTDAARALAVGDGSNDVEMLQWAGVGVAMGSAPSWVRRLGDVLTEPVWYDGCAAVLDAVVERTRRN